MLHSNYQALKFLSSQHKISSRHAKWVEFLQSFSFVSAYKQGSSNVVADALSRRHYLLSILDARVLGFQLMRQYYNEDDKLWEIMKKCSRGAYEDYSVHDGFLFKGAKLCIPKSSFRELLIRETHGGGLAGHFGINKTLGMLKEHFYWPKMVSDVQAIIARCGTCQRSKSYFKPGPYMPLPIPEQP